MNFTPFKFFRNLPPTVPEPPLAPQPIASSNSGSGSGSGSSTNTSRATSLMGDLGNLSGTANYLQSVILSLTQGLGVTVNVDTSPDLGRALSAVYGSVPPAISIQMYSNTLDVELGAQQVLAATGPDSTVQPNPFQNQAVVTINKAVESALSDQGDFASQATLMLRSLKTQSTVYATWQSQLASYPAATNATPTTISSNVVQASSVDVGDATNAALSDHVSSMVDTYAGAFNLFSSASSISSDIACMVNSFATLSKAELAQVNSLITLVNSTDASESMQDISNGLTSFVFVQMMGQASSMVFSLDRIAQMAIAPLSQMTNPIGQGISSVQGNAASQLVGVIRAITQDSRIASGPLSGLISTNTAASAAGGQTPAQAVASQIPPSPSCSTTAVPGATPGLSIGMNDLSTLMDWCLQKANKKVNSSLSSFSKLMGRMQGDTSNQVKLLTIVNNLGTLSSLATAFLSQQQSGAAGAAGTATNVLSTVGSILAATSTGNGTTYTVQNGVVTVIPPTIPAPTPSATAVLSQAGVQTSLAGISKSL